MPKKTIRRQNSNKTKLLEQCLQSLDQHLSLDRHLIDGEEEIALKQCIIKLLPLLDESHTAKSAMANNRPRWIALAWKTAYRFPYISKQILNACLVPDTKRRSPRYAAGLFSGLNRLGQFSNNTLHFLQIIADFFPTRIEFILKTLNPEQQYQLLYVAVSCPDFFLLLANNKSFVNGMLPRLKADVIFRDLATACLIGNPSILRFVLDNEWAWKELAILNLHEQACRLAMLKLLLANSQDLSVFEIMRFIREFKLLEDLKKEVPTTFKNKIISDTLIKLGRFWFSPTANAQLKSDIRALLFEMEIDIEDIFKQIGEPPISYFIMSLDAFDEVSAATAQGTTSTHTFTPREVIRSAVQSKTCSPQNLITLAKFLKIPMIELVNTAFNSDTRITDFPLHHALRSGRFDWAWMLIEQGADINAQDMNSNTPLHILLNNINIDLLFALLARKPNLDLPNLANRTAREILEDESNDHFACFQYVKTTLHADYFRFRLACLAMTGNMDAKIPAIPPDIQKAILYAAFPYQTHQGLELRAKSIPELSINQPKLGL